MNESATLPSLYRRLLVWLLVPMLLLGSLVLAQAYMASRDTADRAFDRLLEAASLAIAEQVKRQQGQLWMDLPPAALKMLASQAEERVFYALYDANGNFISGNAELPALDDTAADMRFADIEWHDMALRLGIRRSQLEGWRNRQPFEVRVAHTREGREALTQSLFQGSMLRLVAMALLAIGVVLLGIRMALMPLTRLRRAIRARDPRTLAPLDLALPRELAELRETLNDLLARMRRVRANQERFIGDASHQLRTPLAGLSARAELALRQDDPRAWHAALDVMRGSADKTARLASQLLSLTRLNNPEATPEVVAIDLCHTARQAVRDAWTQCHRDGIDLGVEVPAHPVMQQAVEWQLAEALANLIDNARRYGARRITVRVTEGPTRLEVEDDGPGIPESQRLLVLRPFHRGIEGGQGSGLGLAIVDGIARTHGARLSLAPAHPHAEPPGLCVRLQFSEEGTP
ncbi:sensor histidine kinase [Chromohalobacter israelensis]|uniref:sensor histidine kinase n=1 Tax=Chromohalobacter israelensis TaxID=141390 RepID=UPI000D71CA45|nr:sensor histidine kinase N-terminal domain-containing protein [Chromohalobacter salexigens]PWW33239.1 signal transduction histidine kinase [Chromohalobacter salexigens]